MRLHYDEYIKILLTSLSNKRNEQIKQKHVISQTYLLEYKALRHKLLYLPLLTFYFTFQMWTWTFNIRWQWCWIAISSLFCSWSAFRFWIRWCCNKALQNKPKNQEIKMFSNCHFSHHLQCFYFSYFSFAVLLDCDWYNLFIYYISSSLINSFLRQYSLWAQTRVKINL